MLWRPAFMNPNISKEGINYFYIFIFKELNPVLNKVAGYNFNFLHANLLKKKKHWAIRTYRFGISCHFAKTLCDRIYGLFYFYNDKGRARSFFLFCTFETRDLDMINFVQQYCQELFVPLLCWLSSKNRVILKLKRHIRLWRVLAICWKCSLMVG